MKKELIYKTIITVLILIPYILIYLSYRNDIDIKNRIQKLYENCHPVFYEAKDIE